MSTIVAIDYRRADQRTQVLENPFWLTSALISGPASEDLGALIFSFPIAGQIILINEVLVQNVTGFTASTVISVGSGTLATDAVTTGGNITIVDADEYVTTADDVLTAATVWGPTTANTSDWLTAAVARTYAAPRFILGAATTVPCVYVTMTNSGTIAAGTCRVHMLVTILPGT